MIELGTVVAERYRLDSELGRGGMSQVFVASDIKFDTPVALKLSAPSMNAAEFKARFKREAMIGRMLGARSTGFVRALDWGEHGPYLYLVMDLVEGACDLDLKTGGRGERLDRLARLAQLVREVHAMRIVHRDLKPQNCLVSPDGRLHLADFGLAKVLDHPEMEQREALGNVTQTGTAMGTPYFMAPEQILDASKVDERADVYALGVMLYLALTGDLPYRGSIRELIAAQAAVELGTRPAPTPRDVDPQVPPNLDALCRDATKLEPSERVVSVQVFLERLGVDPGRGTTVGVAPRAATPSPTADLPTMSFAQLEAEQAAQPPQAPSASASARPSRPGEPPSDPRASGRRSRPTSEPPTDPRGSGRRPRAAGTPPDPRASGRHPSAAEPPTDPRATGRRSRPASEPPTDPRGSGRHPRAGEPPSDPRATGRRSRPTSEPHTDSRGSGRHPRAAGPPPDPRGSGRHPRAAGPPPDPRASGRHPRAGEPPTDPRASGRHARATAEAAGARGSSSGGGARPPETGGPSSGGESSRRVSSGQHPRPARPSGPRPPSGEAARPSGRPHTGEHARPPGARPPSGEHARPPGARPPSGEHARPSGARPASGEPARPPGAPARPSAARPKLGPLERVAELLEQVASGVSLQNGAVRFTHEGNAGRFALDEDLPFLDRRAAGGTWGHLERRLHFDAYDPPGGMHSLRYAVNEVNAGGLGGLQAVLFPMAVGLRRQVLVSDALGPDTLLRHLDRLFDAEAPLLVAFDRLLLREPWQQAFAPARVLAAANEDPARLGELAQAVSRLGLPVQREVDHLRVGALPLELRWEGGDVHARGRVIAWAGGEDEALARQGLPAASVERLLAALLERNRACPYALAWQPGQGVILRGILHERDIRPDPLRDFLGLLEAGARDELAKLPAALG
ncbi:MAG: protein kinase [Planctomycetota bacterium]